MTCRAITQLVVPRNTKTLETTALQDFDQFRTADGPCRRASPSLPKRFIQMGEQRKAGFDRTRAGAGKPFANTDPSRPPDPRPTHRPPQQRHASCCDRWRIVPEIQSSSCEPAALRRPDSAPSTGPSTANNCCIIGQPQGTTLAIPEEHAAATVSRLPRRMSQDTSTPVTNDLARSRFEGGTSHIRTLLSRGYFKKNLRKFAPRRA